MENTLERIAQQRAAIKREYNDSLADGNTAYAERIRKNPDNVDIFHGTDAGEYVS